LNNKKHWEQKKNKVFSWPQTLPITLMFKYKHKIIISHPNWLNVSTKLNQMNPSINMVHWRPSHLQCGISYTIGGDQII
jgi:hypothetical protein